MSIFETLVISTIGGVVGYTIKHYLDLRLVKKSEAVAKKRSVYEEISKALGIFVTGRDKMGEDKQAFLEQYSKLWLWASDTVIESANEFLDIMVESAKSNEVEKQTEAKRAYANFVIEMRKDLEFSKTLLEPEDYKFVSFGK